MTKAMREENIVHLCGHLGSAFALTESDMAERKEMLGSQLCEACRQIERDSWKESAKFNEARRNVHAFLDREGFATCDVAVQDMYRDFRGLSPFDAIDLELVEEWAVEMYGKDEWRKGI